MGARIFTRDVPGFHAGEIVYLSEVAWDSVSASLTEKHNIRGSYAMDVEEAARRYVDTLQPARAKSTVARSSG